MREIDIDYDPEDIGEEERVQNPEDQGGEQR